MSRPRKKWEPQYRFGGNKASWMSPAPLGENQSVWRAPKNKAKKRKR